MVAAADASTGPNGPLETQADLITDLIAHSEGKATIEATPQAEEEWSKTCRDLAQNTLFWKLDTWIFGANIPGKPRGVMFYLGGMQNYRAKIAEMVQKGHSGLNIGYLLNGSS